MSSSLVRSFVTVVTVENPTIRLRDKNEKLVSFPAYFWQNEACWASTDLAGPLSRVLLPMVATAHSPLPAEQS